MADEIAEQDGTTRVLELVDRSSPAHHVVVASVVKDADGWAEGVR